MKRYRQRVAGFTLIELLVVIAIIALLIAILIPALGEARRVARTMRCTANLQQYGVGTQSYASDFEDRIWSFTWNRGRNGEGQYHMHDPWDHPNAAGNAGTRNFQWAARQAIWIFRHRGDRTGMRQSDQRQPITFSSPLTTNWIPHFYYSHLVLNDYLAQRLPEPMVACPEDRPRLLWQSDPAAHDRGEFLPQSVAGGNSNQNRRWPYSSSYLPTVAAFEHRGPPQNRISQPTGHGWVVVPTLAAFGDRRLSDVAFPSQKVHQYDMIQRHFGRREIAWIHDNFRQPLQFFDGSVSVRSNLDANAGQNRSVAWSASTNRQFHGPGGLARNPNTGATTPWLAYRPDHPFEPRPISGGPQDRGPSYYRFTANGLMGYDFDGREYIAQNHY